MTSLHPVGLDGIFFAVGDVGHTALNLSREAGFGPQEVNVSQKVVGRKQVGQQRPDLGRDFGEDADNLLLFLGLEFADAVVGIQHHYAGALQFLQGWLLVAHDARCAFLLSEVNELLE